MMQRLSLVEPTRSPPEAVLPNDDDVVAILEAALRSPSGDNTQPWTLAVAGPTVRVAIDEPRARCAGFGGVAGLMSLGAFVESVRLEAGRRQLGVLVVRETGRSWRIEIGKGRVCLSDLAESLAVRATNRAPYSPTPLPAPDLHAIALEAGASSRLELTSRRTDIERAARAAALAERVRFDTVDPDALFRWLRFTPAAAATRRDGLDVRLLALAPQERIALRLTGSRWLAALMRIFGAGAVAGARAQRELSAAGAIGVIVQDSLRSEAFVESGRVMMRAWLRATALGHAFAPVSMAALLPLTRHLGARFSREHAARLDEAESTIRRVFGVRSQSYPVFLFRVGVPLERQEIRSERRALASFQGAQA